MSLNVLLLQRTLTYLETNPGAFCPWFIGGGTGGFDDWAAWLHCCDGWATPPSMPVFELPPPVATLPEVAERGERRRGWSLTVHGPMVASWWLGRLLLDTDALLADDLYAADNSLADIRRIVGQLVRSAHLSP